MALRQAVLIHGSLAPGLAASDRAKNLQLSFACWHSASKLLPARHGGVLKRRTRRWTNAEAIYADTIEVARLVGAAEEAGPATDCYVSIYDTTLRDGSQMVGISMSVEDKLKVAALLSDFGVEYIEGGWPGSNPKDAEFFARWDEIRRHSPRNSGPLHQSPTKLAAFGSTRRKLSSCEKDANIQALLASEADVVTLVAKVGVHFTSIFVAVLPPILFQAWDEQVERVLETTLEENLCMIAESISYFKVRGKEVMLDAEHFFDGFAANRKYALRCLEEAAKAGADVLVLCDTNGGSMPWSIEVVTKAVVAAVASWPQVRIGIHTHNDCEMAVSNSLAAVRAGATLVQGCINGYGERTGNANLVSLIGTLQVKMGFCCIPPQSLCRLTGIAAAVAELACQPLPPQQPFVGSSAFAHKGGIHVAALRKMPESYNHMEPSLVGNEMRSVVSELSGRGNILDKAERAGLELDRDVAGSVLARIKEMESEGCAFENASASVDILIVRRGQGYKQPFRVEEFSVISSNRGDYGREPEDGEEGGRGHCMDWHSSHINQAIVKLRVDGECQMTAAEGNGPVDALSHALRSALERHYPQLKKVELADFRVRLLEPSERRKGTMSTTRVTIDFRDSLGTKWTTVGAHTSIVEASFRALVDGLEFGIVNCSEDGCTIRG
eukprot:SM000021S06444  [mRNA]  locus=s21:280246:286425:+ [translate_table: standard]